MQKKVFITGGIVLVVITIGLFLYVFFVQKAEEQRPTVSESSFEISDSSSVSSFLPAEEGSLPPTDLKIQPMCVVPHHQKLLSVMYLLQSHTLPSFQRFVLLVWYLPALPPYVSVSGERAK